jgi:hypothetical protein
MKQFDPMATVLSAIENASSVPITPNQVLQALRTGAGEPTHLRALFGDVTFETLIRVGIQHDISNQEIGRAYSVAVDAAGARNLSLDRWCAEQRERSTVRDGPVHGKRLRSVAANRDVEAGERCPPSART